MSRACAAPKRSGGVSSWSFAHIAPNTASTPAMTSPQPPACGAALALLPGGPVPDVSRVGRHKQRYGDSGERLVAG